MPVIRSVQSFKNVTSQVSAHWRTQAPAHICHPTPKMFPPKCPNTLRSVPISVIQLHLAKSCAGGWYRSAGGGCWWGAPNLPQLPTPKEEPISSFNLLFLCRYLVWKNDTKCRRRPGATSTLFPLSLTSLYQPSKYFTAMLLRRWGRENKGGARVADWAPS